MKNAKKRVLRAGISDKIATMNALPAQLMFPMKCCTWC